MRYSRRGASEAPVREEVNHQPPTTPAGRARQRTRPRCLVLALRRRRNETIRALWALLARDHRGLERGLAAVLRDDHEHVLADLEIVELALLVVGKGLGF